MRLVLRKTHLPLKTMPHIYHVTDLDVDLQRLVAVVHLGHAGVDMHVAADLDQGLSGVAELLHVCLLGHDV